MMKDFKKTGTYSSSSWRAASKCSVLSAARADELFFADGAHPDTVEHAKAYCASCPVKVECAAWGAAINAEFGVYGGIPAYARKSLIRLFRDAHPGTDTALLSEEERFSIFCEWIKKNPNILALSLRRASQSHNNAYWAKKRAKLMTVETSDMRLTGVIAFDSEPVGKKCVQLALF